MSLALRAATIGLRAQAVAPVRFQLTTDPVHPRGLAPMATESRAALVTCLVRRGAAVAARWPPELEAGRRARRVDRLAETAEKARAQGAAEVARATST